MLFGFARKRSSKQNKKFEIVTSERTFTCKAETEAETLDWINALQCTNAQMMNSVLRNTIDERRQSISMLLQLGKESFFAEKGGPAPGGGGGGGGGEGTSNSLQPLMSTNRPKRELQEILKRESNKLCADCGTPEPRWVSLNLTIFICIHCSGVHRSLGVHISQVRSAVLDDWSEEMIQPFREKTNADSHLIWEKSLSASQKFKVQEEIIVSDREDERRARRQREAFITDKYVLRVFC